MVRKSGASNFTIPPVGRHEIHIAQGYGLWTQELLDPTSETFSFGPSSVFLIIDGAELLRRYRGREPMLDLGGLRFSIAREQLIAGALERILDAQLIARKKCLLC